MEKLSSENPDTQYYSSTTVLPSAKHHRSAFGSYVH